LAFGLGGLLLLFGGFDPLDVRNVDGALLLDNGAVRVLLGLARVPLHHAHTLDDDLVLAAQDLEDLPLGPAVVAGGDADDVALVDVGLDAVHSTSGARDTIFMKFFSRSSRATGPKMRVPRGLRSLSMMTMALVSKRSAEPSGRRS